MFDGLHHSLEQRIQRFFTFDLAAGVSLLHLVWVRFRSAQRQHMLCANFLVKTYIYDCLANDEMTTAKMCYAYMLVIILLYRVETM